jgi:hypothetical protein
MAAFKAMCEGYLGISAHWHLFKYFFMFTCLKDGSKAMTTDCANLRMKQGRGDDYIPFSLTSSNNGCHKGWFYLRNDPEFTLHRAGAKVLDRWPPKGGAGDAAQGPLGGTGLPPRGQGQPGDRHWPVPRPRGRTTSETAAAPLRDDDRQAPWVETVTAPVLPSLEEN